MKQVTDAKTHRAARDPARKPQPALPLQWWRTIEAQSFDAGTAAAMREAIWTIAIIDLPTWRAAAGGDVAAATGLSLRLRLDCSTPVAFDLIMTAVATCAAEGDATACLVMAFVVLRRRGASQMNDIREVVEERSTRSLTWWRSTRDSFRAHPQILMRSTVAHAVFGELSWRHASVGVAATVIVLDMAADDVLFVFSAGEAL